MLKVTRRRTNPVIYRLFVSTLLPTDWNKFLDMQLTPRGVYGWGVI